MQTPHDTLFHFTFRHAAHAASWLRGALPTDIAAAIDWSTLTPVNERLPGLQLRSHHADLVFVAALRDGSGHVLILIEHKSHRAPQAGDQILRYAVLLQNTFQQRYSELPLVLAVLLQHGEPAGSDNVPTNAGLFTEWQPSLRFVVDDVTTCDEATLRLPGKTPLAELSCLSLHFLPQFMPEDVPRAFDRWQDLLRAVDRADAPPLTPPMGRDAIDAIGWYTLAVTEVSPAVLAETFTRILHRPDNTIMSTLERTYQKGMAEGEARGEARGEAKGEARGEAKGEARGEARGEAKGRAETLLRMLHKRFGPLDTTVEQRLRSGTPVELDAWTDRILEAPTLAAVLDGPAAG